MKRLLRCESPYCSRLMNQTALIPFFGRPRPLPILDLLFSSLPLGLVGGTTDRTDSLLSLSESPRPESLEEVFLRRLFTLALSFASWMLPVGADIQFPLISLLTFPVKVLSSSPEGKESLRSPAPVDDESVWNHLHANTHVKLEI